MWKEYQEPLLDQGSKSLRNNLIQILKDIGI